MIKNPIDVIDKAYDKNFYRRNLLELVNNTENKPILFSGRYKYHSETKYYTFTNIKPVLAEEKACTICDHINFRYDEIMCYGNFSEKDHNKKFYLIGFPDTYFHFGEIRGTIKLDYNIGIPAIFPASDRNKYLTSDIKDKLFYLDPLKYAKTPSISKQIKERELLVKLFEIAVQASDEDLEKAIATFFGPPKKHWLHKIKKVFKISK